MDKKLLKQAYDNLIKRGFNKIQSKDIFKALKFAAEKGRQSHYTLEEAVLMGSEGLLEQNSIKLDTAGITKNISNMHRDYIKEHSIKKISKETLILAEYYFIMKETKVEKEKDDKEFLNIIMLQNHDIISELKMIIKLTNDTTFIFDAIKDFSFVEKYIISYIFVELKILDINDNNLKNFLHNILPLNIGSRTILLTFLFNTTVNNYYINILFHLIKKNLMVKNK